MYFQNSIYINFTIILFKNFLWLIDLLLLDMQLLLHLFFYVKIIIRTNS